MSISYRTAPLRPALLRLAGLALVMLALTACNDDDPAGPGENPLEAFAGSWTASSFVYTSVDDPEVSVPVLQAVPGSSVAVEVETDGSFVTSLNLGPQTENQTVQIPGTITHEGGNQIIVTFATNPFFTAPLEVTYAFQTTNTLSWEADTTFDFNQDGEATPAVLNVVFQRG